MNSKVRTVVDTKFVMANHSFLGSIRYINLQIIVPRFACIAKTIKEFFIKLCTLIFSANKSKENQKAKHHKIISGTLLFI